MSNPTRTTGKLNIGANFAKRSECSSPLSPKSPLSSPITNENLTLEQVRRRLFNFLSNIHSGKAIGSSRVPAFAYTSTNKNAPNPGLKIKGVDIGIIGLPVSSRDLRDIIASSNWNPSPSPGACDRKIYELESNEFEFKNPDFLAWIRNATDRIKEKLGIVGSIEARPCRLLLYVEGGLLKPQGDLEKVPGRIGTIVVTLPCKHVGGELSLSHGGESMKLDSASSSAFGFSIASWYSGVTYAVRPVSSGCRLAVTFHLVSAKLGAQNLFESSNQARMTYESIITAWSSIKKGDEKDEKLLYLLSHEYSETSLKQFGSEALKGNDRLLGDFLLHMSACGINSFDFYIANITKYVTGTRAVHEEDFIRHQVKQQGGKSLPDSSDEDAFPEGPREIAFAQDPVIMIDKVFDPSTGDELDFFLDMKIRQEDAFQGLFQLKPSKWKSHFIGNEGVKEEHWYKSTVLLLFPIEEEDGE